MSFPAIFKTASFEMLKFPTNVAISGSELV